MSRRILIACAFLLSLSTSFYLYNQLLQSQVKLVFNQSKYVSSTSEILARGERISLSKLTQRELLQIPNISELRAQKLIDKREKIIAAKKGCASFEIVHGIGPVKALEICQWIAPE